uniref:Uncharacterized protein n=1 Tax=Oryza meridionalis TaxID=40149 RepID=A0A0E0F4A6_9ORYZ
MAIDFFPMLASCFRPPSSSAAARRGRRQEAAVRRRPDKAEKRRWVDEQVGLHLAARAWDGCGKGGAVDVSRYGDIGLEAALGYEFERRWWAPARLGRRGRRRGGRQQRRHPTGGEGCVWK